MKILQIVILILSILLILSTGFNIYAEFYELGWVRYISWVSVASNLASSMELLIGVFRNLRKNYYKNSLVFLYIGDFLSLVVFIIYIIYHILNYAKIINIVSFNSDCSYFHEAIR